MEDIMKKLNSRINKNDTNFILDNRTKDIFKNLNFFHQIMLKYPDIGDSIITEIILKLYIRKYNQFEIIWDDNKTYLNGIFIVLYGVVNVYIYNFQNKAKSNEIKLNISTKKIKKSKEKHNNIPSELNIPGNVIKKNNKVIDELKPLKIFFVAKKGDSIGNTFLNINKIENSKKNKKKEKDNHEMQDNKHFYKIESKTKSIIAFLTEEDYNTIFEKIVIKERHDKLNFLHKIHYMPKDQTFIERFQNYITKKCFTKNSTIFKQNDEFQTIYIIIYGSVRISINFNKKFFCSLDFDVLIGNNINDRFTSSRLFEITGNYREKENFFVVDLEEGEILGGIEFCKNLKNYIFTAQCITDVILYEVNIKLFTNILAYFSFKRFYNKIDNQLNYFRERVLSINNFRKEKGKKDDYSFSQNKFIQAYKRGHPISAKKEAYINRYINPFKFEKIFKSKELKTNNIRYNKDFDFKKMKNKNETLKQSNFGKMAFITNVPRKLKRSRKLKKSKTMLNLKSQKNKYIYDIDDIKEEEKKNNDIKNNNIDKSPKIIKKKNILRQCSSALNINTNNKNIRKINDRRLKSCRIENKIITKINYNFHENKINNSNSNYFTTKNISTLKYKMKKDSETSTVGRNKKNMINESTNYLYKNYNKNNIKQRNNSFLIENLTDDSNKNISNNLKFSYSDNKQLIYNKLFTPISKESRNISQPQINHKSVVFPSGIREMDNLKIVKINELLTSFISNSYIRNELKLKKINNINAFILQQNFSKMKNKKINLN